MDRFCLQCNFLFQRSRRNRCRFLDRWWIVFDIGAFDEEGWNPCFFAFVPRPPFARLPRPLLAVTNAAAAVVIVIVVIVVVVAVSKAELFVFAWPVPAH